MLEVGTGLGYQAAVMAEMGAEVFSVEVVEEFAEAAEPRFAALGYDGRGARRRRLARLGRARAVRRDPRHRRRAPSRRETLVEQLAPGGRMVIPLGGGDVQQLSVVDKAMPTAAIEVRSVMPVRFTRLELSG